MTKDEKERILARTLEKIEQLEETTPTEDKKNNITKIWVARGSRAIAASIAAFLILGGTAFAAITLNPSIRNYFGIENEKQKKLAAELTSSQSTNATAHGVQTKITQIIADSTGFVAAMQVKGLPEDAYNYTFENIDFNIEGISPEDMTYYTDMTAGGIDDGIASFNIVVKYNISMDALPDLEGKKATLSLRNLGKQEGDITTFKVTTKGTWKMNWRLSIKDHTLTNTVNKDMTLMGSDICWKNYELSPLSIKINFDVTKQGPEHLSGSEWEKYDGTDRIVIQLTDGRRIDSRFSDDVQINWGDNYVLSFKEIIDPQDVAAVSFGGQTITLKDLDKEIEYTRFTSKVGNFTLELPKDFATYLTMEETKTVKNKELSCKEDVISFEANKDGVKKSLFTIHRLYTDKVEKIGSDEGDPFMKLIGQRDNSLYAIKFCELTSEEELNAYADLLNQYDSSILPGFEYIK